MFGAVVFLVPAWELTGGVWPGVGLGDAWNWKDATDGDLADKVEAELERASVAAAAVRPFYNEAMLSALGEVPATVVRGSDGWLFQASTVRGYPPPAVWPTLPESCRYIQGLSEWLESRGCQLLLLLVPNKSTVYSRHLEAVRPRVTPVYDQVFEALAQVEPSEGHAALWLVDPRPVLLREGDPPTYLPTDTHWTPQAANEVAALLAAQIEARLGTVPGPPVAAHVVAEPETLRLGDLVYSLGLRRGGALERRHELPVVLLHGEALDGAPLVSSEPAAIALAGTSFSHSVGLAALLASHLGRTLEDRAQIGKGPTASLMQIIEAVASGARPAPELLVWEFPERYLFLTLARLQEPLRNFLASQSYDEARAEPLRAARVELFELGLVEDEDGVLTGTPTSRDPAVEYVLEEPLPGDGRAALVFRVTASHATPTQVYLDRGAGFPDRPDGVAVVPRRAQEQLIVVPLGAATAEGAETASAPIRRIRIEPVKGKAPFRMTRPEVWPR